MLVLNFKRNQREILYLGNISWVHRYHIEVVETTSVCDTEIQVCVKGVYCIHNDLSESSLLMFCMCSWSECWRVVQSEPRSNSCCFTERTAHRPEGRQSGSTCEAGSPDTIICVAPAGCSPGGVYPSWYRLQSLH